MFSTRLLLFAMVCLSLGDSHMEGITAGKTASHHSITYQLQIKIKTSAYKYVPTCGGALIDSYFGLSVSHCFIDANGIFEEQAYSVMAGTIDLEDKNALYVEVSTIYTITILPGVLSTSEIVVLQFKTRLDIDKDPRLSKLELTDPTEWFDNEGIIAGFGYHWVIVGYSNVTKAEEVYEGGHFDNYLRYTRVKILSDKDCESMYPGINSLLLVCAMSIPETEERPWGACSGDSGNALVVKNKNAIGIMARGPINCDDTVKASIYTKIKPYRSFIDGVLTKSLIPGTKTYTCGEHPW